MAKRISTLALACIVAACGATPAEETLGTSHADLPQRPIELMLKTPEGQFVDIGDLRGAPTLLFLFATFDGTSQAALLPVARFHREHPEVHVVGIPAHPDSEELLRAYVDALHVPFTVGFDPEDSIARGTSMLGRIEEVPTYFALDRNGFVVDRHVGFASESKLEHMLAIAQR